MNRQQLLFVELPGFKPLVPALALKVAGGTADIASVTDANSANRVLEAAGTNLVAVLLNSPHYDLIKNLRERHPSAKVILITDLTMDRYSAALNGEEDRLLDHIIANRSPQDWTQHEVRITLQKILQTDIFGVEKYLSAGTPVHMRRITSSQDRETMNGEVMEFAELSGLNQHLSKLAFGITEELLMNAIYDAPMAGGKAIYGDLPRTAAVELASTEQSDLFFGCDSLTFAVAVRDPFGALKKEKLFQYLKKVLRRDDTAQLIDTKKGGAGLGLFKILYSSHSLVCNVVSGRQTEVIALIDLNTQIRDFSKMTRSIHYFSVDS